VADPSRVTVAEYLREWLDAGDGLSPKTLERYRELVERQIIPHLGAVPLQKLRAAQVAAWHTALSATGLAARTVGHAHRVLHRGLARAVSLEIVSRNVARAVPPPKVASAEISILSAAQMVDVIAKLDGHRCTRSRLLRSEPGCDAANCAGSHGARSILMGPLLAWSAVLKRLRPGFASSRRKRATGAARSACPAGLSRSCEPTDAARRSSACYSGWAGRAPTITASR
jgi:hypothetical protein